jgi:hypothetical protein
MGSRSGCASAGRAGVQDVEEVGQMALPGEPETRRGRAIDLDGLPASPVLDLVPYVTADEIGRRLPKPAIGDVVEVEVLVEDDAGHGGVHVVALGVHATAFAGRRWVARCPTCGRPARLLRLVGDGVRCGRCSGLPRWSERHAHKRWYTDLVRPLRQAARLRLRAYRRPKGSLSRRCLHRAARRRIAAAKAHAAGGGWWTMESGPLEPGFPPTHRPHATRSARRPAVGKQPGAAAFSPRPDRLTTRLRGRT